MKIYTKTGDAGMTGLFGGRRVSKDSARVEAYGAVDETNAVLGIVRALLAGDDALQGPLAQVQSDLFVVGADLATPEVEGKKATSYVPRVSGQDVVRLERWIDEADEALERMKSFILPSGTAAAAQLHFARTVCRRAERRVVGVSHEEEISEVVRVYLNRLSDLLFMWARLVNQQAGVSETPWHPPMREDSDDEASTTEE